ncbi:MAG TPA: PQQ-dependent sugar dehydrogenase [Polyangiaceae bacterium]|nr:PQQ-dependent sugar dehydrogenase [Polyangiaceae bacterium]
MRAGSRTMALAAPLALLVFASCGDDEDGSPATGGSGGGGGGATGGAAGMAGAIGGAGGSGPGPGGAGGMGGLAGAAGATATLPARLVELIASDAGFNPSRVFAAPGAELIVQLRNEGTSAHGLGFELGGSDPALDAPVDPGETAALTITVPVDPGDYPFFSGEGDDRSLGLEGVLTVRQPPRVRLVSVATGLISPVAMAVPPDESGRLFIVGQRGEVRVVTAEGDLLETPFLDLSDQLVELEDDYDERGLLGLAFHPDYPENGRFFVHYSAPLRAGAPQGWDNTTTISEFTVRDDNPDLGDSGSERVLLEVDQPQSNHAGGTLAFGPDGYLYISLGDGGGAGDVDTGHTPDLGNGQDISNLLGSLLRIDVDAAAGALPYGIPADNPFAASDGADEIFAYGFRNPYRFSFDMGGDGSLLVGDAGQRLWEEVSLVTLGGNYGWNVLEGTHCFDPTDFDVSPPSCPAQGASGEALAWPVIELANSAQPGGLATTVIGGYVYRGSALPELAGRYVFGSFSITADEPRGLLMVASREAAGQLWPIELIEVEGTADGSLGRYLKGFGQDHEGELYVLTSDVVGPTGTTGAVHRLE